MLRFIQESGLLQSIIRNFNTSHVTVYHVWREKCLRAILISIHPMLRFITLGIRRHHHNGHISIHPMLRFIIMQVWEVDSAVKFQYIPCYGLSFPPCIV